jgi:type IV secretion system protein VirB10
MYRPLQIVMGIFVVGAIGGLLAIDSDRDFSGDWVLDASASQTQSASGPVDPGFTVVERENAVECSAAGPGGSVVKWSYALDRSETRYQIGGETRNSEAKWEGAALLVNTLVSGPQSYTVMDRWRLSNDRAALTIERHVIRGAAESEGVLVYRRRGQPAPPAVTTEVTPRSVTPVSTPSAAIGRPAGPAAPSEITVPAGTHIPLSLRNPVDTKHSREGDRVYLETVYPITVDGRVVIPRGSFVNGTVTVSKKAGVVKGKGELFLRFDQLTLPNGVTRDFRSRLDTADTATGKVDRKEGTITGERDKTGEAKSTAEGAGIGASVGGIAGAAAGRPLTGVGIEAAAGAAAGLASVLLKHRPDASLPAGTTVEMVLDRDLRFLPTELK